MPVVIQKTWPVGHVDHDVRSSSIMVTQDRYQELFWPTRHSGIISIQGHADVCRCSC